MQQNKSVQRKDKMFESEPCGVELSPRDKKMVDLDHDSLLDGGKKNPESGYTISPSKEIDTIIRKSISNNYEILRKLQRIAPDNNKDINVEKINRRQYQALINQLSSIRMCIEAYSDDWLTKTGYISDGKSVKKRLDKAHDQAYSEAHFINDQYQKLKYNISEFIERIELMSLVDFEKHLEQINEEFESFVVLRNKLESIMNREKIN